MNYKFGHGSSPGAGVLLTQQQQRPQRRNTEQNTVLRCMETTKNKQHTAHTPFQRLNYTKHGSIVVEKEVMMVIVCCRRVVVVITHRFTFATACIGYPGSTQKQQHSNNCHQHSSIARVVLFLLHKDGMTEVAAASRFITTLGSVMVDSS
jgi:hypothetical protein